MSESSHPDTPTSGQPVPMKLALLAGQAIAPLPAFRGKALILAKLRDYLRRFDYTVRSTYAHGLRVELNPHRDGSAMILLLRHTRPVLAPILDSVLEPGSVFADVGASIGIYSMYGARCVGPKGRVFSFEAVPQVAAYLRRNLELNGFDQAEISQGAVGAEPGTVAFFMVPGISGLGSKFERLENTERIEVPQITLDDFFADRPTPHLIKVDAEGADLEVLRGAFSLLQRREPPVVVFEAKGSEEGALAAFKSDLAAATGYRSYALTSRGVELEPIETDSASSMNLLLARKDQPRHAAALERLLRHRFPKNQNI